MKSKQKIKPLTVFYTVSGFLSYAGCIGLLIFILIYLFTAKINPYAYAEKPIAESLPQH